MQKLESQRRPLTPEEVVAVRAERLPTGCGPIAYVVCSAVFVAIALVSAVITGRNSWIFFGVLWGVAGVGFMVWMAVADRFERRRAGRYLNASLEGGAAEVYEIHAEAFAIFEQEDNEDDDDDDKKTAEYAFALDDDSLVFLHGKRFREDEKFPCLDFSVTQIFDVNRTLLTSLIEHRGPKAKPLKTIAGEITKTLELPGQLEVRRGRLENLENDLRRVMPGVPETYGYIKGHGVLRKVDTEKWRKLLLDHKVNGRAASLWSKYAKPNIRLIPKPLLVEDTTAPLTSKLGGLPDLPRGMEWPTFVAETFVVSPHRPPRKTSSQVRPLSFVAQINLADIAKAGCDLPLPESGLLLFFYDSEWVSCGLTSAETTGARAVFLPEQTATERVSASPAELTPARPLECQPSEVLPDTDYVEDNDSACSPEDFDEVGETLDDVIETISYDGHAFGGWPYVIQNTMELECELYANGIEDDPERYREARARGLDKNATAWRLLLQLDSSDIPEWKWGDSGKIYFLCREEDIAARRFERCCVIQQMA
jgi:uncharacterized protein YwqG